MKSYMHKLSKIKLFNNRVDAMLFVSHLHSAALSKNRATLLVAKSILTVLIKAK